MIAAPAILFGVGGSGAGTDPPFMPEPYEMGRVFVHAVVKHCELSRIILEDDQQ